MGWHPKEKNVGKFTKDSGETRSDKEKNVRGDTLQEGWQPSEINKSDSDDQNMDLEGQQQEKD